MSEGEKERALLEQSKKLFCEANDKDDIILYMLKGMVSGKDDADDKMEWGAASAAVLHLNDRINQLEKQVNAMVTLVGEKI